MPLKPIKVGMTASLTGRYAYPGRQALAGVQAWVADTNRSGGNSLSESASGIPLELVYYDDESRAQVCQMLYERLVE